jgi:ABC-type polysaccharide/polyol phosphate export permease
MGKLAEIDAGTSGSLESPTGPEPVLAARTSIVHSLAEIATDFWAHRDLLHQLTLRDIRLRYKQAVMGFAWSILTPTLIVLSGVIVRLGMARFAGSPLAAADVASVAVKGPAWAFFVGSISFATASVVANSVLVTKVYFPREMLPLSAVLAQGFDSLIAAMAVAVLLPFLGVGASAALLWVPLLVLLLVLLTAGAALLLSCANLFFRDVKYIVQVGLTFGIFFTPVLFEPAVFGSRGAALMMLNPVAPLLEGLRLAVVAQHDLLEPLTVISAGGQSVLAWTPWYLAYAALWSVGGAVISALVFHRLEYVFAEYV